MAYIQRPGARIIASEFEWQTVGRYVQPDAVPIIILWPFSPIRFVYERYGLIGKGAHAEQRGVSEQQCDKHDQGQEKPPVEILFGPEGGAAVATAALGTKSRTRGEHMGSNAFIPPGKLKFCTRETVPRSLL